MLDETMVPLTFWGQSGNVVKVDRSVQGHAITENVSIGDQKASVTLIATVCNDPGLQPHLKQILLPKGKRKKDSEDYVSAGRALDEKQQQSASLRVCERMS